MSTTRLVSLDDAAALAELVRTNREFLAPWEPVRDDGYFTIEGQLAELRSALSAYESGTGLPHVICDATGAVIGRITLNGIVHRSFQSCSVGYWVGAVDNGRGIATAALGEMRRVAFADLGLHRIQAETLPHNIASQRVLERNGFERIGMAPAYLNIAGKWQDHVLYQVLAP